MPSHTVRSGRYFFQCVAALDRVGPARRARRLFMGGLARSQDRCRRAQRLKTIGKMPFDGKRMIMGGFEPILAYHRT